MRHEQIEELLGAYALDAVDEAEREEIDLHIARCERCRDEVDQHRETAALISAEAPEVTADVWPGIRARLGGDRVREGSGPPALAPSAAVVSDLEARRERDRSWRVAGAIASVAAVVFAALATVSIVQQRRLDDRVADMRAALTDTSRVGDAFDAAIAPGSKVIALRSEDGGSAVRVVYTRDGSGYVVPAQLPALEADHTYQLWAITEDKAISLGLLGNDPQPRVPRGFSAGRGVDAFAITEEAAGGAERPTADPVVAGDV